MNLNKKVIKIVGAILIILVIFTFSIALAKDDTVYVWSSEAEPISSQTNAKNSEQNEINEKNNNIDKIENVTKITNQNEIESSNTVADKDINNSLNLQSGGAILIEQKSGKVLYNHNAHEKLRPASVTKVMSILLIMEALDSGQIALTDKVPCTEDAAGMGGSQIWLEVGEELTVDEMLKAICVVSANDCTEQFRHL